MIVKIRFDDTTSLIELSHFCGVAPCSILATNHVRSEAELIGSDIFVPVVTSSMIRESEDLYIVDVNGNIKILR